MKGLRKFFMYIMLLIIVLSVNGCENTDGKKNASMGRFVEEVTNFPQDVESGKEEILGVIKNGNGENELYTAYSKDSSVGYARYVLDESGTWKRDIPEWAESKLFESNFIRIINYGNDGKLYVATMNYKENSSEYHFYELMEDGTEKEIIMEDWKKKDDNGNYQMIKDVAVMEDGNIVIQKAYSNQGKLYDENGIKKLEFENGLNSAISIAGTDIISISQSFNKMFIIDKETGLNKNEITISQQVEENQNTNMAICSEGNDNIYIANNSGIYYIDKSGSVLQTMVDGATTSLSVPTLSIVKLLKETDGSFFVLYRDNQYNYQYMHYVYRDDIATVPDKVLTIYSLEDCTLVNQASIEFQRKHPEVSIDFRIAKNGESSLTTDDYVKALNSEILAGDGADIIICDNLAESSYVEKGIFADISDIINPLTQNDEIYSNIVDCYRKDNCIYTLPLKFEPCVYAGKSEVLDAADSMGSLCDYYKNNSNISLMGEEMNYEQLFYGFYRLYSDTLFDKQGTLYEDKFIEFLEQLKSMNSFTNKYEYTEWFDTVCYLELAQKKAQLITTDISSVQELMIIEEAIKAIGGEYRTARNMFHPCNIVGLNKQSKNKELAKEFIQSLLSEEVQKKDIGKGIPINKNAIKSWSESLKDGVSFSGTIGSDKTFKIEYSLPAKQEQLERLTSIINGLSAPVMYDTTVYKMIADEIEPFLKGYKNAEKTTNDIIDKAKIYSKE